MRLRNCFSWLIFFGGIFGASFITAAEVKDYSSTINTFKESPQVQPFFDNAYGYAVFPTIGKGGLGIGGAYGKGQVYQNGTPTGSTKLYNLSIGWQAGGQAFSQIIFFQDQRAYKEFTSGEFALDAQASAVVVTAGVQAKAGTEGATASVSAGPRTARQATTDYHKGIVIFIHPLGGLMVEAAIAGQKFSFTPFSVQ
ncbi:MAG: hypothetical protein PVI90_18100 [Desulfobacteraceae bacterium]|jgi:lipid-binding SYLF domain-containing protein